MDTGHGSRQERNGRNMVHGALQDIAALACRVLQALHDPRPDQNRMILPWKKKIPRDITVPRVRTWLIAKFKVVQSNPADLTCVFVKDKKNDG